MSNTSIIQSLLQILLSNSYLRSSVINFSHSPLECLTAQVFLSEQRKFKSFQKLWNLRHCLYIHRQSQVSSRWNCPFFETSLSCHPGTIFINPWYLIFDVGKDIGTVQKATREPWLLLNSLVELSLHFCCSNPFHSETIQDQSFLTAKA